MDMDKQWVAEIKGGKGSYEVSVCYGIPDISWGWLGREKIRIEGGNLEDASTRAAKIAAALNAAEFNPGLFVRSTCTHGYTVCAVCKFPAT